MKFLVALALTSLCTLAVVTVRLRNSEVLSGYRTAWLEREAELLKDQLMSLESEAARMRSLSCIMNKAIELRIILHMDGFEETPVELIRVAGVRACLE